MNEGSVLLAHSMYIHLMEVINAGNIPKDKATDYKQTAELWLSTLTDVEKINIFDSTH